MYDQVITFPSPVPLYGCVKDACSGCTCSGGGSGYCRRLASPSGQCVCAGCGGASTVGAATFGLTSGDTITIVLDVDGDLTEMDETNNTTTINY